MPVPSNDEFRLLIEHGDADGIRAALQADAGAANRTLRWHVNQVNESEPLHYVSDCVGQGLLGDDRAGEIAELLIAFGAALDGTDGRESPLIASASLGAERVSKLLIEAGADLEATSVFGARAIHWAAWTGMPATVERLLAHGAQMEAKCAEFGATPLFWAVHGYGPNGPQVKRDQVGAARVLIRAGANVDTVNTDGLSALELAKRCVSQDMYESLHRWSVV
jgi:ankyrin repeat protein